VIVHRSNFQDSPLSYVEVGASEAADLMRFPPSGATPFYEELHIGSGEPRFLNTVSKLMTWEVFSQAGFAVANAHAGEPPRYRGIQEGVYGPDGQEYTAAGMLVEAQVTKKRRRTLYVVHTIHEDDEVGLILGTADAEGVTGEVRLSVQRRENEKIWVSARGFFHPAAGVFGAREVKAALGRVRSLLEAHHPGNSNSKTATVSGHDDASADAQQKTPEGDS
jgi:uncharacterized protein (UPF0548 family)